MPQDSASSNQVPSEKTDIPEQIENVSSAEDSEQGLDTSLQLPETSGPIQTEEPSASETEQPVSEPQPETQETKILIAYFTWAENTVVDDPSAVEVDATTSASVLVPGHVAQMAGWIQSETGGDLFSIVAAEPYSSDYDECLDRAADEKADSARPTLTGIVGNMADYNVIFLGYPDWWGTCPMAVFTFLDSYDFTGKTVIPFCAHGTSGLAASVRDIRAALPDVTVLDAVGVQRPGMDTPLDTTRSTVTSWLAGLDY
ncbi:MAG: flavodoxin [Oscillibacter sp.]|nr:flavodoxin [Oscillibacter sp.]